MPQTQQFKKTAGRPSIFKSLNLQDVKRYVLAGLTDEQLAVVLKITKQTLNNYKHNYPEFFDSLKNWKGTADKRIERSLYERACGYTHPAVKFFQCGQKIIQQKYLEHHPPDTTACIFWLKNRQPEQWRDRQEHDHTGEVNFNFNLDGIVSKTERSYASVN